MKLHLPLKQQFLFCLTLLLCFATQAQNDYSDPLMIEKKYVYGKEVDDTEKKGGKSNADIWFSKYTAPVPGFVVLKDGKRVDGKLVLRQRYNKASYKQIKVGDTKKPDPAGRVYYEYKIDDKTYKAEELKEYGLNYTVKDYEAADAYHGGKIYMNNGDILEGKIRIQIKESGYKDLNKGIRVFYAATENDFIVQKPIGDIDYVSLSGVGGDKKYQRFKSYLILPREFEKAFGPSAKSNKCTPLQTGVAILADGSTLNGKVALDKRKKKRLAFFMSEDKTTFLSIKSKDWQKLKITEGGKMVTYFPFEGKLLTIEDVLTAWREKENLFTGKIVLDDGTEKKGQIAFRRDANVVKSYRLINGVYFLAEDSKNDIDLYKANSGIEYAETTSPGEKTRYVPLENKFVDSKAYIAELEQQDSKKEHENLHAGYFISPEGKKHEGRIAGGKYKMVFVSAQNELDVFSARDMKHLEHYVQNINGKQRKFIPSKRRPFLGEGPDHGFVEVEHPNKRFSYYKNPYPTHGKKGLTKAVAGAASAGVNVGMEQYAQAKAKEAGDITGKEDYNEREKKLSQSSAYAESKSELNESIQVGEIEEGDGFYFEEWVIIDNSNDSKAIVYKKNEDELLLGIAQNCPTFSSMDPKEQKKLLDSDKVPEFVEYMNNCLK